MSNNEYLKGVTDIEIVLSSSSWGRLQCNATTYDGRKYHSWTGEPSQPITREMLIDALDLIEAQIPKRIEV